MKADDTMDNWHCTNYNNIETIEYNIIQIFGETLDACITRVTTKKTDTNKLCIFERKILRKIWRSKIVNFKKGQMKNGAVYMGENRIIGSMKNSTIRPRDPKEHSGIQQNGGRIHSILSRK